MLSKARSSTSHERLYRAKLDGVKLTSIGFGSRCLVGERPALESLA
jgi:hypothetical protein